jgi:hypothetical protein
MNCVGKKVSCKNYIIGFVYLLLSIIKVGNDSCKLLYIT